MEKSTNTRRTLAAALMSGMLAVCASVAARAQDAAATRPQAVATTERGTTTRPVPPTEARIIVAGLRQRWDSRPAIAATFSATEPAYADGSPPPEVGALLVRGKSAVVAWREVGVREGATAPPAVVVNSTDEVWQLKYDPARDRAWIATRFHPSVGYGVNAAVDALFGALGWEASVDDVLRSPDATVALRDDGATEVTVKALVGSGRYKPSPVDVRLTFGPAPSPWPTAANVRSGDPAMSHVSSWRRNLVACADVDARGIPHAVTVTEDSGGVYTCGSTGRRRRAVPAISSIVLSRVGYRAVPDPLPLMVLQTTLVAAGEPLSPPGRPGLNEEVRLPVWPLRSNHSWLGGLTEEALALAEPPAPAPAPARTPTPEPTPEAALETLMGPAGSAIDTAEMEGALAPDAQRRAAFSREIGAAECAVYAALRGVGMAHGPAESAARAASTTDPLAEAIRDAITAAGVTPLPWRRSSMDAVRDLAGPAVMLYADGHVSVVLPTPSPDTCIVFNPPSLAQALELEAVVGGRNFGAQMLELRPGHPRGTWSLLHSRFAVPVLGALGLGAATGIALVGRRRRRQSAAQA